MMIDLVVFDLAGTTVRDNKDVQRVLQNTMAKFDIYITPEEADNVMGIPKPVAIRQLLEKYSDDLIAVTDEKIEAIHEMFVDDMKDFYRNDPTVAEADGVTDTFTALKQSGIKIVVDTGFDRAITDVLLQRLGWLEKNLIDFSITSDEVPRGRPFPDMIIKSMEHLNIQDARRVMKVGDTSYDLQEGNAAGCGLVIGITTGAFSREMLLAEEHTHLIDSIPEILPILNLREVAQNA